MTGGRHFVGPRSPSIVGEHLVCSQGKGGDKPRPYDAQRGTICVIRALSLICHLGFGI